MTEICHQRSKWLGPMDCKWQSWSISGFKWWRWYSKKFSWRVNFKFVPSPNDPKGVLADNDTGSIGSLFKHHNFFVNWFLLANNKTFSEISFFGLISTTTNQRLILHKTSNQTISFQKIKWKDFCIVVIFICQVYDFCFLPIFIGISWGNKDLTWKYIIGGT